MRRTLLTFTAALLALAAAGARAEPPAGGAASGRIDSDEGRVEILGRPLRAGDTIRLPEGYLRVEEDGREERDVGSFTVVPARAPPARERDSAATAPPAPGGDPASPAGAPPAEPGAAPSHAAGRAQDGCRAERSADLAELWRLSGIEVSSPADLVEGLDGRAAGPKAGFFWFALQTDPFRPLAWSSELRARAEALTRCVRRG